MTNRILIVDDDELNLRILEEILHEANFETMRAMNGLQAMALLEEGESFDLILLDRMMPEMDGMQVMERLKADDRWKNIPVVMQTAATAPTQVIEGATSGVYYYLTKPFEEEMVLSIVRSALQGEEQMPIAPEAQLR